VEVLVAYRREAHSGDTPLKDRDAEMVLEITYTPADGRLLKV
jgi:hypothetical protein